MKKNSTIIVKYQKFLNQKSTCEVNSIDLLDKELNSIVKKTYLSPRKIVVNNLLNKIEKMFF